MIKWINARDRLPEHCEDIVGRCKDGKIFVGRILWYSLNVSVWEIYTAKHSTRQTTRTVTHWFPLSELENLEVEEC